MQKSAYSPRTWRTIPLHLLPPDDDRIEPILNPLAKPTLDWVFLISALNFSFWSQYEGTDKRYAVEWREGWGLEGRKTWNGYWSLLAAINRGSSLHLPLTHALPNAKFVAMEEGIPITDPLFYSSETRCPDALIAHIFRESSLSVEPIPLLAERIQVMRGVGNILCQAGRACSVGFYLSSSAL